LSLNFHYPLPGFIILSTKRHLFSVDELNQEEQEDFMKTLVALRKAMRVVLNIEHVYLILEEDTTSSHFHLWIFPRYDWMTEKFGKKIQSVKPIMEYARDHLKNNENIKEVEASTKRLKEYLDKGNLA
jgi:diadenosine tetraphosphate (Ap4A) HIT family hydrolase